MFIRKSIVSHKKFITSFSFKRYVHSDNQNSFVIFGLGNPSPEFDKTRHSIGKIYVNKLASTFGISFQENKNRKWKIGKGLVEGNELILVTSDGYMNNSGSSLSSILQHLSPEAKYPISKILALYDEIYLSTGELRLKFKGSDAGHNGMKDIIARFGKDVPRVKIGIGSPPDGVPLEVYVLQKFSMRDQEQLNQSYKSLVDVIKDYLKGDLHSAHRICALTKSKENEKERKSK